MTIKSKSTQSISNMNFDLSELQRNYMDGKGNMFNTVYAEEDVKEFINLIKREIERLRDYKGGDGTYDNPIKEKFIDGKAIINIINHFAGEDLCSQIQQKTSEVKE